jgi:cobalamin biosynthesis protein CobD/CbiB
MNNYAYTFIAIAVYLVTIAVVYHTLHKRFTGALAEIETNYRLSLSRACTAFVDAMNAISKALDTDESEQTTLSELSERQTTE